MRHLLPQLIMGFPPPEPGEPLTVSILKAIVFRAAITFLTASLYPASAAAPTCAPDTHGRPAGKSLCVTPANTSGPGAPVSAGLPPDGE